MKVEIHGTTIRKGETVGVFYPAANRDETVFEDPYRFDITRRPNDYLSFGFGAHFCLGTNLARAELRAMVHFARANLVDAPTDAHRFDIIFCRHVLGDADPARRGEMFDNLERRLVDDGCLFLGPDEQPENDSIAFRPVAGRKGLFVKSPAALRRVA